MSAVSKKLMPRSTACLTTGRDAASSSTHGRHCGEPYVIMPRQMRETFRPVEPRRAYSMFSPRIAAATVRRPGDACWPSVLQGPRQLLQSLRVHGLGPVVVEPRIGRAALVL